MFNQFPLIFVASKTPISNNLNLLEPVQLKSGAVQSQTQPGFFKLDPVQLQAEPPEVPYMEPGVRERIEPADLDKWGLRAPHKWGTVTCPSTSHMGLGTDSRTGVAHQTGSFGKPIRSVAQCKESRALSQKVLAHSPRKWQERQ